MSDLQGLRDQIAAYPTWDEREDVYQIEMLHFLDVFPDCLYRTQLRGHFTASAWVLDIATESVLLIHHRKLNKWLQPGGHADGEPNLVLVAQREVLEETGLRTLPLKNGIFDLDIHQIPERGAEPSHLHYDVRFLLQPESDTKLDINHEVKEAKWIPLKDIHTYNDERSITRMLDKILAQFPDFQANPGM